MQNTRSPQDVNRRLKAEVDALCAASMDRRLTRYHLEVLAGITGNDLPDCKDVLAAALADLVAFGYVLIVPPADGGDA